MEKVIETNLTTFSLDKDDTSSISFEKIYKSNSIIFGRLHDTEKTRLTAYDYKNLNFLYRLLQEVVKKDENPPVGAVTISCPIELFKIAVDSQDNWKKYFMSSILRLDSTRYLLKDYLDENTKQKIELQVTQLLAFPKFFAEANNELLEKEVLAGDGNKIKIIQKGVDFFQVTFPKEIAVSCWQHRGAGYTHIDFRIINRLKNKISIKFYEVLLSKIQLAINMGNLKSEIVLGEKELSAVFDKRISLKNNLKNMLLNSYNFEKSVMPELTKELPIYDYSVNQKDFTITFFVDESKIDDFAKNKLTPFQLEAEKFQNLIEADSYKNEYSSGLIDASSTLYVVNGEKIHEALNNFQKVIHDYLCECTLMQTDDEKIKYGDVVMVKNRGFCDRTTGKNLTRLKRNRVLEYLYKNYYSDIMQQADEARQQTDSGFVEAKAEAGSVSNGIFAPFLNIFINISENDNTKIGRIDSVTQNENGGLTLFLSVFDENDIIMATPIKDTRTFNNIIELSLFVEKNKA